MGSFLRPQNSECKIFDNQIGNTVAKWKFGELWQTLTFFEIVPNFNLWERLFPDDSSKSDKRTKMTILVAGATGGVVNESLKSCWLKIITLEHW